MLSASHLMLAQVVAPTIKEQQRRYLVIAIGTVKDIGQPLQLQVER